MLAAFSVLATVLVLVYHHRDGHMTGSRWTTPGGHPDCTANIAAVAPHSEYEMAKKIGTEFLKQQMCVRHATTDGDARAATGFQDAYTVLHPMWKVEILSDPTHLGRSQFRKCMSATFSKDMFPRLKTRDIYQGKPQP